MHANNSLIRQAEWQIEPCISQSNAFTPLHYSIGEFFLDKPQLLSYGVYCAIGWLVTQILAQAY